MKLFLRMTQTGPEAYSLTQLRQDNPSVSFPDQINAEVLADFGVYECAQQDRPQIDPRLQRATYGGFAQIEGAWFRVWSVLDLADEAKAAYTEAQDAERRAAYAEHADPVFFKWQRGEVSEDDWLAAVAMVKGWYSDANTA
jgi:hypothetical protein